MRNNNISGPSLLLVLCIFLVFLLCPAVSVLSAPEYGRLEVMIVLDNSGSMKKNDPMFLAGSVVHDVLRSDADINTGLVIFDTLPALAVSLASYDERDKIIQSLEGMDYRGAYSDTPAAVETALYELKVNARDDSRKIIILMTDGIVDTGNKETDRMKWEWLRDDLMLESKRLGVRIFGIAFNNIADFRLLQTLALNTGGDYYRVENTSEARGIFKRILNAAFPEPVPEPALALTSEEIPETVPVKENRPEKEIIPGDAEKTVAYMRDETRSGAGSENKNGTSPVLFVVIPVCLLIASGVLFYFFRLRRAVKRKTPDTPVPIQKIPRAILIDINNITGNRSVLLDKRINMIGRDPNNDIVIPKETVSSFHAIIEYKEGFFYLEDHRSMNKTRLGGEELAPQAPRRLKSGDEIEFNIFKFRFVLPDTIPSGKTTIDFHGAANQVQQKKSVREKGLEIPELPRAILVDVSNVTGQKTIRLIKKINRVGRGTGSDVRIDEKSVSGLHATIEYREGFFYIEDQRSKNSTFLGDRPLTPNKGEKLKSGDEIIFDSYKFIFLLEYELPSGDTGDTTFSSGKDL